MERPFDVVIDLTQFGLANEVQSQWVQQFIQILPSDVVENLHTLIFYNTNTSFKKYVKKMPYILYINYKMRHTRTYAQEYTHLHTITR